MEHLWGRGLGKAKPERLMFHLKTCSFWDHGLLPRYGYFSHSKGFVSITGQSTGNLMALVHVLLTLLPATGVGPGCCLSL